MRAGAKSEFTLVNSLEVLLRLTTFCLLKADINIEYVSKRGLVNTKAQSLL